MPGLVMVLAFVLQKMKATENYGQTEERLQKPTYIATGAGEV